MSQSASATVSPVQLQITNDLSATPQPIVDSTGTASALELSTGNIVVSPGGNLGIGTNPVWPLHVGAGQTVRFEMTNGALFVLGAPGVFAIDKENIAAGRFVVDDNGNVGINQPNPTSMLEVNGTFANPAIQPHSSAPSGDNFATVTVDTKTGVFYYQD